MNQIEKNKRYDLETESLKKCNYNSVLYLTNRQVSVLTAVLMLVAFFLFLAGYFLGQRKALERYSEIIEYGSQSGQENFDLGMSKYVGESVEASNHAAEKLIDVEETSIKKEYKAQLIGFGTSRAAHSFADKLQNKNMPVRVDERHSKTAQGKEIIWYQVTTEPFTDKEELLAFVEKIKKEERIKDIRIVSC